jgi:hypothetical protein
MYIQHDLINQTQLPTESNVPSPEEYYAEAGQEHYRLLAWLSLQWNDVDIFDIGTHKGNSSSALAFNSNNRVLSFDIDMSKLQNRKSNCFYYTIDLWNNEARELWKEKILASPLIFLDIDPHEGEMEYNFYLWLLAINYQGLLLLDDIWYFKGMRDKLWYQIANTKWDLTSMGHWSGSGLVDFSNQVKAVITKDNSESASNHKCLLSGNNDDKTNESIETSNNTSNDNTLSSPVHIKDKWTIVTAYFDLTKEPDASDAIRARPLDHYLKEAQTTMCLPQHLIVYCDENTKPLLEKLRPPHLAHKTRYIIKPFASFSIREKSISDLRETIQQNRKSHPYQFDTRNTASYYLFCMLRYVMLDEVIASNPFETTHFAWVNINIENYGWHNAAAFESCFALHRDKFSTCWIDYIPKSLVENYDEYFRFGRCGMCSGFFTGNYLYFHQFNQFIIDAFFDCLEKGYGHADEQLYSIVYYQHPEIFEPYFGDYTEMITNYVYVKRRATEPIRNIIQHSLIAKDYAVCLKACQAVWPSRHTLPPDVLKQFEDAYSLAKMGINIGIEY